ncbi:phosphatase PAP2 family protein [uncultured Chloroflexus sp.]|uniref:phosphatase PAP2 family protein n=1 Tax=uncultured Chloroflexus sp. TaxID=214040 RepID=UPI00260DE6F2|nr:phosphatase PAP2 family protein [uncultured Chloroflexus sp.]
MMQPNDLTAEALSRGALPGRGYAIARRISQILHPVPLSIVSIFIVGVLGSDNRVSGLWWSIVCALLHVVPPTIFFNIRLRQGAYSDDDISVRTQRNELYLFGMVNVLVGTAILWAMNAPLPLLAMLVSVAVMNAISFVINLFWKISIHSASIGSCATLASIYLPALGGICWAAAIVLGWARLRTRNHTLMQVIAGMSLAVVCVLVVFRLFGLV